MGGQAQAARSRNADNHVITDPDFLDAGGAKAKFRDNLAALRVLKTLREEGREATPEEREIIAKYVGWGRSEFRNGLFAWYGGEWQKEREELEELIGRDEFESARKSTLTAFWTPPRMAQAVWRALDRLGFKGGRVHEPSIGTGIFYGTMPTDIRDRSVLSGADKDVLASEIARALYPGAKITNGAYQEENLPDDFYDLVVGNFPFADFTIRRDKYNHVSANLHDYFWLKSLGIVRPGGLVAAITSTGTMDKANDAVRREIADKADVVAAIRLPEGTFSGVAGTDVVTDLIILRKRETGEEMSADTKAWLETVPYSDLGKGLPGQVNQYYKLHPDHIVGSPTASSGRFGMATTIKLPKGESAQGRIDSILAGLPENVYSPRARRVEAPKTASAAELGVDASTLRDGSLVAKDGEIWENTTQGLVQVKAPQNQKRKAKFLIELRDALNSLRSAEINDKPDGEIASLRKDLNRRYDAFAKEYGPLSKPGMLGIMDGDPSSHMLLALERSYDKEKNKAVKADIFTTRVGYAKSRAAHAENYEQAAGFSMNETGHLDAARVGEMMGVDTETAERELLGKGLAYRAPDGQLVGSDEYLSGNVREKLRQAEAAARVDPAFKPNVEALRKVLPADKGPGDITVNLGATWVPPDVMSEFAAHVLGVPSGERGLSFEYSHALGRWLVSLPADRYSEGLITRSTAWKNTYATKHRKFTDILDAALHDQRIRITFRDPYTGATEFDAVESEEANTKADKLKDEFLAWVWKDKDRAARLARIYNDTFNGFVERKKGGRWLTFPGIAPSIKPRAHQVAAVEKMLASRRLLMAHEVGTGKTITYGLMARKAKETGSASKPLLVVTNSTVQQVAAEIQGLFPDMNIFVGGESMTAARRKRSMAQIANNNWDLVILTHDNLASLDADPAIERKFIDGQIMELRAAADAAMHSNMSKKERERIKRNLLKRAESLTERLKALLKAPKTDGVATFQDLGFDMIMVDECQVFKKLPIATYRSRVKGIPVEGSKRASALLMNIENLLENNPEACVVFGSGTPLDNSLVEAYVWQRYLQNDLLKSAGITSFDAWASNFGRATADIEMSPSGGDWKEVERFKEFVNLGELSSMMRQNMDVVFAKDTGEIVRPERHDSENVSPETEISKAVSADLQERARKIKERHGKPKKGDDNMLVVCGDGRKAAVHPGLYKPEYVNAKGTKAEACIKRVAANHKADPKAAQMIFCDCGVNDTEWGFNLYRFLRDGLVKAGFKPSQVAFFSSGLSREARADLAKKMNNGEVLVAIGSTDTMGTGVNAQERLRWMHHLDASRRMTPGSIEQRNGRGHRQGNTYKDVEVVYYTQQSSLDAFTWNLIKNKAGFINSFMHGEDLGTIEEESDTVSYDQLVASASGDPRVFKKAQLEKQLHRLRLQEAAFEQSRRDQATDKHNSEWRLKNIDGEIKSLQAAVEVAAGTTGKPFSAEVVGSGGTGRTFTERDAALSSALGTAVDAAATRLKDTEWRRASDRATVAKYRGFDIQVGWEQQLGSSGPRLRYYLEMPDGTRTAYYLSPNFGDDKKTQMLAVFRSADAIIGGLKRKLQGAVEERANTERRIGELAAGLDRKFEHAEKITSLQRELQQLNDALSGKDKEKQKQEGDKVENPPESSARHFQRGTTAPDWSAAKIPELRKALVARGLSPIGSADVLRARLSKAAQPSQESRESQVSHATPGAATRKRFAENPETAAWRIEAEPSAVAEMPAKVLPEVEPVCEGTGNGPVRNAIRALFRKWGTVTNDNTKEAVVFNPNDAGKMMMQGGVDMRRFAPHMRDLFKGAVLAWTEPPQTMKDHSDHWDVEEYRQYVAKFDGFEDTTHNIKGPAFVRFTVRVHKGGRHGVHAASVTDIEVLQNENAAPTVPANKLEGRDRVYLDPKLRLFLADVKPETLPKSSLHFQRGGAPAAPVSNPWDSAHVELQAKKKGHEWHVVAADGTDLGRYATQQSAEFAIAQERAVLGAAADSLGKLKKARLAEIAEARRKLVDAMRKADATKEERADAIAALGRALGLHKDLAAREWALAEKILRTHDPESTEGAAEMAERAVNTVLARASIKLHGRDMMRIVKRKAGGKVTGGLRRNALLPVRHAWDLIREQMTEEEKARRLDEMDRTIEAEAAELQAGEGPELSRAELADRLGKLAEKMNERELLATFGGLATLHGGENRARLADDARAWADASAALSKLADNAVQELKAKLIARAVEAKEKSEQIISEMTGGRGIPASEQERERAKNDRGWLKRAAEFVRGFVSETMGDGVAWGEVITHDKSVGFGESTASHLFHDGLAAGYKAKMEADKADREEGLRILAEHFGFTVKDNDIREVFDFSEKCASLFNDEAVDENGRNEITIRSVHIKGKGKERQVIVSDGGACTLKLGELMHFYLIGLQAEAAAGQAYTDTPKRAKGTDCTLMESLVRRGFATETMMEIRRALQKRGLDRLALQISADMEKKGDALDALMAAEYNSQLKRVHPYAPLRRLHWGLTEKGDTEGGGVASFMSLARSFLKERTANSHDFKIVNLIESWQSHNRQANHIIHLHDWISTVGRVMRRADMQTALNFVVGDRTRRSLNTWLDIQARDGATIIRDDGVGGMLARNFAVAVTTNPRVSLKQLTSFGMALGMLPEDASTWQWFKDMAHIALPCKERREFLAFLDGNSIEWRERGTNASDALSAINRHRAGSKWSLIRVKTQRKLAIMTRWGDRNGALLGCYGVFRAWERKFQDQGMDPTAAKMAALEKFVYSVNAGQQSVMPEYVSKAQAMGGLYKYMAMFHTAQIAMARNLYIHAKAWHEHRGDRWHHARAIMGVIVSAWAFRLMGKGMQPLFQILRGLFGDDPDSLKSGATATMQEGIMSVIEAPCSGVMPVGDVLVAAVEGIVKGKRAIGITGNVDIIPHLSIIANIPRIVDDFQKKADKRDWLAVSRHAADLIGQTTGIPITPVIDVGSGLYDAKTATDLSPEQRAARALSFSRSAIGAPRRKPAPKQPSPESDPWAIPEGQEWMYGLPSSESPSAGLRTPSAPHR